MSNINNTITKLEHVDLLADIHATVKFLSNSLGLESHRTNAERAMRKKPLQNKYSKLK